MIFGLLMATMYYQWKVLPYTKLFKHFTISEYPIAYLDTRASDFIYTA